MKAEPTGCAFSIWDTWIGDTVKTSFLTTVRLNVEENQLVDVFGEIGTRIAGLKGA